LKNTVNEIPKRLTPKSSTLNILLSRSGNQCSFPNCSESLFNDKNVLIAECCHIEAALPGGERFNEKQTNEERRNYSNLIFFCHKHHIETNDINVYTVKKLKEIKKNHHKFFSETPLTINTSVVNSVIKQFGNITSKIESTVNSIKRIEDKQDSIIELLNNPINSETKIKINAYFGQPATPNFIGRIIELKNLQDNFEKYNTHIIQGTSGIGKSSLIAYFASTIKSYKILWIDCVITNSRALFLALISEFIKDNFNDSSLEEQFSKDDDLINNYLTQILKTYSICLIFDSLNSNAHKLFPIIKNLNEKITQSKILITTTQQFNILDFTNPFFKINLKGLLKEDFNSICELYGINKLNDEDAHKLYISLGAHPYLLKLSASIISYQTINSFLSDLENRNIYEVEDFIKNNIVSELNVNEKELLKHIVILDIPFRYSLTECTPNFPEAIKSLQQKFLIDKKAENLYNIPEYIKLYLKNIFSDTNEFSYSKKAVEYLLKIEDSPKYFEKNALIILLIKIGEENQAKTICSEFISDLMKQGHFDLVLEYGNKFLLINTNIKWDIIYYVLGRVYRMKKDFKKSLEMYDYGINLKTNTYLHSHFLFEKASILIYQDEEKLNNSKRKEAIEIYNNLSNSKDISIVTQSKLSLIRILIKNDKPKEALKEALELKKNTSLHKLNKYVYAQVYHSLGDAFRVNSEHKKAFESFDLAVDLYKEAAETYGMNTFEGLYHLYISYGETFSNAKDYESAAQMFGINVTLAENFKMTKKLEDALLDFGYHLILSENFKQASIVLEEYYNLKMNVKNLEIEDLPFIYGSLMFSLWYSNNMIEAIELLALYINTSLMNQNKPLVTVIENLKEEASIDIIEMFKKGMKILIIPKDKSINDFHNWINQVCIKKPEFKKPLSSFLLFKKP
tara:strand:- start:46 stop:2775 length:2730 start_codon:yes stop_codon:yes gene_type:complete